MITDKIKVSAVAVDGYDQHLIDEAVGQLLDQLGGIDQFVTEGDTVLLKANLVRDMHPDQAGTTHPTVLCALANIISTQCNATVIVGDSSGGLYTKEYMNAVYRKTQMTYVSSNSPAQLNSDFGATTINIGGKVLHSTSIIDAFVNADVVINVGKLKMHSFAGYTGAVKNLFGLIAGLVKVELHSRYPDLDSFVDCLIDIEQYASSKTKLHILDAVVGMEGSGPTNGKPRKIGQLIASSDPYLCDYVANSLYCDPLSQPVLNKAVDRGVLDSSVGSLDFDMDSWAQYYIEDFDKVTVVAQEMFLKMPQWLRRPVMNQLTQKAVINGKKCRACQKCIVHCPQQAITLVDGVAHIDQSRCIRCYCCQELCPFDAVKLNKPLLYKVVRGLSHGKTTKQVKQK